MHAHARDVSERIGAILANCLVQWYFRIWLMRHGRRVPPRFRGPRRNPAQHFNHILERCPHDTLSNKHNPRSVVSIWPLIKPCHGVQEMLCPLNDRRPAGLLRNIDQAFDTQKTRAKILGDAIEQELQLCAEHRLISDQAESLDVAMNETMIVPCVMLVIVTCIVRMACRLISGEIQPSARISARIPTIEALGFE